MTRPIPEGFHSITPHIVCKNAGKALEFYIKAFGAKEHFKMPGPDGSIMHAEFQVGDSIVMMAEEMPAMQAKSPTTLGGSPVTLHIYCDDTDAMYKQAVAAGANGVMEPSDAFWGDRYARVDDPFGHSWAIATNKEKLTPEEIAKRAQAAFAQG